MDEVYGKMEVKRWSYGEDDDNGGNQGLDLMKNGGDERKKREKMEVAGENGDICHVSCHVICLLIK